MQTLDRLLSCVIAEAKAQGIPVSDQIHPHVMVNKRAKSRFGCCKKVGKSYTIEVCEALLSADEGNLKKTLAHEVLHTCPGCGNHGLQWKAYANTMQKAYGYRINRVSTYEELGLPKPERKTERAEKLYVLRCLGCGMEIRRSKMSKAIKNPQNYRCRCGGRLERI